MKWFNPIDFQKVVAAEKGKDFTSEPPARGIRKTLHVVVKAADDDENGALDFKLSTGAVDRDEDTISPKGWNLKHFRKNPVVLFAHDGQSLPVGRAKNIRKSDESLDASAVFTPKDLYPFGHTVGQMYRKNFLNAVSVGFKPIEFKDRETQEARHYRQGEKGWFGPIDYLKQELLEYSAVPVPSNPEALVQARSAGIDMAPMREWAEKVLDGEGRIWIPKSHIETVHQTLKTSTTVDMGKNAYVADRFKATSKQRNWFHGIEIEDESVLEIVPAWTENVISLEEAQKRIAEAVKGTYPEDVVSMFEAYLGALQAETKTIRRCRSEDLDPDRPAEEQVWCVLDSEGENILGRHATREEAEEQLAAIEARNSGEATIKEDDFAPVTVKIVEPGVYMISNGKLWKQVDEEPEGGADPEEQNMSTTPPQGEISSNDAESVPPSAVEAVTSAAPTEPTDEDKTFELDLSDNASKNELFDKIKEMIRQTREEEERRYRREVLGRVD